MDSLVGNGGDDVFSLVAADLLPGESISGGTDSGAGDRDTLLLTNSVGTYDFRSSVLTGIETLRAVIINSNHDIVMTFAQVGGLSLIELSPANVDRLTMVGSGDVAGLTFATINGVEGVYMELIGDATLTGGQVDRFNRISFAPETTLTLTSTSAGLNLLPDLLVFGSRFSAAAATSGVTLDLSRQSEALTLTGSAQGDVLRGGASGDMITGGGGRDSLYGNAGDDTFLVGNATLVGGSLIDGGGQGALGDRISVASGANIAAASLVGVETVGVDNPLAVLDQTVTMDLKQLTAVGTADLGAGNDTLNVSLTLDIFPNTSFFDLSALTLANLASLERTSLTVDGRKWSLQMSGEQANAFSSMTLHGENFLYLTSTSTGLNAMSDADFQISGLVISGDVATNGLLIDLSLQSESIGMVGGDASDTLLGGSGADVISLGINDVVSSNGGADRFLIFDTDFGNGAVYGGSDTVGSVDQIELLSNSTVLDNATIVGVERIVAGNTPNTAQVLTINAATLAGTNVIDLGAGTDQLNVVLKGAPTFNLRTSPFASLTGVEQVALQVDLGVQHVFMTGAQANLFTAMNFADPGQNLWLSSTSTALNAYSDDALTGLVTINATGASAGVTIDISRQSEAVMNIFGSAGADYLVGNAGSNTFAGNGGADTISAGDGDDVILVQLGTNFSAAQFDGGGGNDRLELRFGVDLVSGLNFTGIESIVSGQNPLSDAFEHVILTMAQFTALQSINLGTGVDRVTVLVAPGPADHSGSTLPTLSGVEHVSLSFAPASAQVTLTGAQLDLFNQIDLNPDNAVAAARMLSLTSTSAGLNALSDAALRGGAMATISAASASDSGTIDLNLQAESFRLIGGGFADRLVGGSGNDTLFGGVGADTLDGGGGNDTLDYQASNVRVLVNLANSTANGGHATGDVIARFENVLGSALSDVLTGSSGVNRIDGGAGRDVIVGGGGADILSGGLGSIDVVSYAGSLLGVNVDFARLLQIGGDAEGDQIDGFESITGSARADRLAGNASKNTLAGGDGADVLSGRAGADSLLGGRDNDTLDGGSGADTLSGDAGADTFVLAIQGGDMITDFISGSDVLRVSAAAFQGGLAAGALDASLFIANGLGQATDGLQRFVYDTATGELFFDDDGNGADLQKLIATFTNAGPLLASDFLIV